jgi:hypothetical protein
MGLSVTQLAEMVGCEFNALLGMDILVHLRALVDVPNKKITFDSDVQLRAATIIPMRRLATVPIIEVTVLRQKHEAVFDTGAPISYVSTAMTREIARKFGRGRFISDFYPGYGHFRIETWSIPISVESKTFRIRVGALHAPPNPDSGIAITLPLRMVQASATAAAEQPCAAPIRASMGSRSTLAPGPPSGE